MPFKPKRRYRIPSWWFSLRPNSGYAYWFNLAKQCERKGISKLNVNKVKALIKEIDNA